MTYSRNQIVIVPQQMLKIIKEIVFQEIELMLNKDPKFGIYRLNFLRNMKRVILLREKKNEIPSISIDYAFPWLNECYISNIETGDNSLFKIINFLKARYELITSYQTNTEGGFDQSIMDAEYCPREIEIYKKSLDLLDQIYSYLKESEKTKEFNVAYLTNIFSVQFLPNFICLMKYCPILGNELYKQFNNKLTFQIDVSQQEIHEKFHTHLQS